KQELDKTTFELDPRIATTVMMVAGGYPEEYQKGHEVTGLENVKESIAFHAGTKQDGDKVLTNGGRLIAITSYGNTIKEAVEKSFANAERISYSDKYYRRDIGKDLMAIAES
ncbi:MAG TPA: phosphoribosylglycinamide synthetase C domain-containing protein, partial [Bacteroidia bacterium]